MRHMKFYRILCMVVLLITLFQHSSFADSKGTVNLLPDKTEAEIQAALTKYELSKKTKKNICKIEVYDHLGNLIRIGSGARIVGEGLVLVNKSTIQGGDYFIVNRNTARNVVHISEDMDLAILVIKDYVKDYLDMKESKQLKQGDPVYIVTWDHHDPYSIDQMQIDSISRQQGVSYIKVKDYTQHGTGGNILLDENGDLAGISSSSPVSEQIQFIPSEAILSAVKDEHTEIVLKRSKPFGARVDNLNLTFENMHRKNGSKIRFIYRFNGENSDAIIYERIKEKTFRETIEKIFCQYHLGRSEEIAKLKDFEAYLQLEDYLFTYIVKDGNVIEKEWTQGFSKEQFNLYDIPQTNKTANTIVVDKSGKLSSITTVTEALAKAESGAVIVLEPGVYNEHISIAKDNLTIQGKPGVLIQGNDQYGISIHAQGINIKNVEIKGKNQDAVHIEKGQVTLINCTISSEKGSAVHVMDKGKVTIMQSKILNNGKSGVILENEADGRIENSTIIKNAQVGIEIGKDSTAVIEHNVITNNQDAGISTKDTEKEIIIVSNDITQNGAVGIKIENSSAVQLKKNFIHENHDGVLMFNKSRSVMEDNNITSNKKNGVHISSGSVGELRKNAIKQNQWIGLYISEMAKGHVEKNEIRSNNAYGIAVDRKGTLDARENIVVSNHNHGVFFMGAGASGQIEKNEIKSNHGDGIAITKESSISAKENNIHSNQMGITITDRGKGLLENNNIFNNKGDGIAVGVGGIAQVYNNIIYENNLAGIYLYQDTKVEAKGNKIYKNAMGIHGYSKDGISQQNNEIYDNLGKDIFYYISRN